MGSENPQIEKERQAILEARRKGTGALLGTYVKLSGPGWLQSAITLGGGSLAGALYLGVLGGYSLLWLQVLAIFLGVAMLSTISYITLSTGKKPFEVINRDISPVLGWGWAIGSLLASMVWCMPQFALSSAAIQQNLLPGLLGSKSAVGDTGGKIIICAALLALATSIVWQYGSKGKGIKVFEWVLKSMVALVVISFFGVVVKLAFVESLPWGELLKGYIPNISQFTKPAESFTPFLSAVIPEFQSFWTSKIVGMQQDVMIAAAAAAVGINMTFLLPYSMLNKGWGREFRGLAVFDLNTGMVIPFLVVTSCVVIAAASQFHTKPGTGLLDNSADAPASLKGQYTQLLDARLKAEWQDEYKGFSSQEKKDMIEALPMADKQLAAMLVKRDAFNLAKSLAPLTGSAVANIVFGIGILGMGLSTIIILMLISGFVICEMMGFPQGGKAQKWGSLAAATGVLGPFVWTGQTLVWVAIPTSVFCMMLLPIAYFTFWFMMNSKKILKDDILTGGKKIGVNILLGASSFGALIAAGYSVWNRPPFFRWLGIAVTAIFILAIPVVNQMRKNQTAD